MGGGRLAMGRRDALRRPADRRQTNERCRQKGPPRRHRDSPRPGLEDLLALSGRFRRSPPLQLYPIGKSGIGPPAVAGAETLWRAGGYLDRAHRPPELSAPRTAARPGLAGPATPRPLRRLLRNAGQTRLL